MPRERARKRLGKKAKKGFRGYPLATLAFYGPDATRASKVALGIFRHEGSEAALRRWFSETGDVRQNEGIAAEILDVLSEFGVLSVTAADGIVGCPHEEGVDYEGPTCPKCPYWAGRDRWNVEHRH